MPNSYETLPEEENYLGSGKFGVVERVRQVPSNRVVACKSIRFQGTGVAKKLAELECTILSRLRHPNVIQQLDVRWMPNQVKIYMEYCRHGSLQDLINYTKSSNQRLSEGYIWHIAFQIASALVYCHHGLQGSGSGRLLSSEKTLDRWHAVLHRDIKPANVFLTSTSQTDVGSIKLGDFGLGQILQDSNPPSTYVGTYQYLPPEITRQHGLKIAWTTQCDIYSFGCTVYSLCALKPPYEWRLERPEQRYDPLPECYLPELRRFIANCLSFQPKNRPDAIKLLRITHSHILISANASVRAASESRQYPRRHQYWATSLQTVSEAGSSALLSMDRALNHLTPQKSRSNDVNTEADKLPGRHSSTPRKLTRRPPPPSSKEKHMQTLRNAGHDLKSPSFDAGAAMLWAARHGNESMVQLILEAGSAIIPGTEEHGDSVTRRPAADLRNGGRTPLYYWDAWFGYVPRTIGDIINGNILGPEGNGRSQGGL